MAKFHLNSPKIWNRHIREVAHESLAAGWVLYYLTSCRHRGSEGIFDLSKDYVVSDIGLSSEIVDEAFAALIKAGYICYDADNEVVLDRHGLRYYQPVGEKQIKGALNRLEQVSDSPLKKEFLKVAYVSAPEFADRIVEAFPELAVDDPPIPYPYRIDTASRARAREEHREEDELEKSRGSDFGSNGSDLEDSEIAALAESDDDDDGFLPGDPQ